MVDFNQDPRDLPQPELPPPSDDFKAKYSNPQFAQPAAPQVCSQCATLLTSNPFKANGKKLCPACAASLSGPGESADHAAFVRATIFGIGGALAGLALYAGVTIATGWTIGYAALAVGWLVATAMLKGSGGRGGQHYQILAVALTYAGISLAAVPEILYYAYSGQIAVSDWGALTQRLIIYGLASPFLHFGRNPASGLIGLFIVFIGLRIAWRMTKAKAR